MEPVNSKSLRSPCYEVIFFKNRLEKFLQKSQMYIHTLVDMLKHTESFQEFYKSLQCK